MATGAGNSSVRVKWTVEKGLWAETKVCRISEHSFNTFKEASTCGGRPQSRRFAFFKSTRVRGTTVATGAGNSSVRVKWTVEKGLWAETKVCRISEHSFNTFKEASTKLLRVEDDRKVVASHSSKAHVYRGTYRVVGEEKSSVRVEWTVEKGLWAETKVFRLSEHSSNTFKEAPTKLLRPQSRRFTFFKSTPVREPPPPPPPPPCGGEEKVR